MPLRVLAVQPAAGRGGSERALVSLLAALPGDRFERFVAVNAEPAMRAEMEAAGANVQVVPMRRITTSEGNLYWFGFALRWPLAVFRLIRLIRRHKVDVVVSNSLHTWYAWAAAFVTRRPHVWIAREIVVQSGLALRLERILTRRFATVVVSMSRAIAAQLSPRDGRVFADAPDPARFSPARAGTFRAAHGIPDASALIGFVGRIDTWKGIDVLLDAWAAPSGDPARHLAIAGPTVPDKEDYAADLQRRAVKLPNVHWIGPLPDTGPFMADLDVLVMPSTEPEPFGLVLVEALASGVPGVATDHGGPPEILAGRPDLGLLVPPHDAAALAVAIDELAMPSDAASRRARQPLLVLPPPPWAQLLDEVAAQARVR
jgi:glycosyltransferase involved in cell wall biosynthesis